MAAWLDPPWYPEMLKLKHVTTPQICLNTTCGTGAESTNLSVINNTESRFKFMTPPVPGLGPSMALIDPLFVRLQPSHMIAQTGFDAFSHAMEGYINRIPSRHTAALAIQVMKLVAENLREFASNRMNDIACENMCWAESMAGVGLCLGAGIGIVHGCGHVMAALTDAHHGFINGILSSPLERWNQPACPDKFADIARLSFGVNTTGMTKMEASDKFFDEMDRLLTDLGIKSGHLKEQIGLQEKDLEHVARYYQIDWGREGNPRDSTIDQTVELLRSIL
jgi:alcohol dehydrogenase class IV